MPHDKNGSLLKRGDRVTMELEVEQVSESDDCCNLTLRAVGAVDYLPDVACNSKLVEKIGDSDTAKVVKESYNRAINGGS